MKVTIKRVYEEPSSSDGQRILVDRLWPRGLTKEHAAVDVWIKDIAPSNELREWFGHDPDKWAEFKRRFSRELDDNKEVVAGLRKQLQSGHATLVYGAKDEQHNNAVVIKEYLEK